MAKDRDPMDAKIHFDNNLRFLSDGTLYGHVHRRDGNGGGGSRRSMKVVSDFFTLRKTSLRLVILTVERSSAGMPLGRRHRLPLARRPQRWSAHAA
jgi:hypothetical protein